jgi:hypothetical protein
LHADAADAAGLDQRPSLFAPPDAYEPIASLNGCLAAIGSFNDPIGATVDVAFNHIAGAFGARFVPKANLPRFGHVGPGGILNYVRCREVPVTVPRCSRIQLVGWIGNHERVPAFLLGLDGNASDSLALPWLVIVFVDADANLQGLFSRGDSRCPKAS